MTGLSTNPRADSDNPDVPDPPEVPMTIDDPPRHRGRQPRRAIFDENPPPMAGRTTGYFAGKRTSLLLGTKGAKGSGEHRVSPLTVLPATASDWVLVASKGGAPDEPRLVRQTSSANPIVTGREWRREVRGPERPPH